MSNPSIADATAYLQTIGLTLVPIEHEYFRFSMFRNDRLGLVEHFTTFRRAWRDLEIHAYSLLQHAKIASDVADRMRAMSPLERSSVFSWFLDGGDLPEVVERCRASNSWIGIRRMPPRWKEELRPFMGLVPLGFFSYVASFVVVLRHTLIQAFPEEATRWFNRASLDADQKADETRTTQ